MTSEVTAAEKMLAIASGDEYVSLREISNEKLLIFLREITEDIPLRLLHGHRSIASTAEMLAKVFRLDEGENSIDVEYDFSMLSFDHGREEQCLFQELFERRWQYAWVSTGKIVQKPFPEKATSENIYPSFMRTEMVAIPRQKSLEHVLYIRSNMSRTSRDIPMRHHLIVEEVSLDRLAEVFGKDLPDVVYAIVSMLTFALGKTREDAQSKLNMYERYERRLAATAVRISL